MDENKWLNKIKEKADIGNHVVGFLVTLGAAILAASYVLFTCWDLNGLKDLVSDTVSSAGRHVSYYIEETAAHRTETLINLADKARGFRKLLEEGNFITEDELIAYAKDQRISGLIVLDWKLHPVYQYDQDGLELSDWENELKDQNVRDIAVYSQKNYMKELEKGDSWYDFVAISRTDASGVIIVYCKKDPKMVREQSRELSSLFADYTLDKGGMILVLKDKNPSKEEEEDAGFDMLPVSSNTTDEEMELQLEQGLEKRQFGLIKTKVNGQNWYGDALRVEGYTVCAFFPSSEIFHQRTAMIGSILVLYVFFVLLFFLIRSRMEEKNLNTMNKQYRIIEALSTVYTVIFMVDLASDKIEVVNGPASFMEEAKNSRSAKETIEHWSRKYVTEPYMAKYHQFMDFSTVKERLSGRSHIEMKYQMKDGTWCQAMMMPKRFGEDQNIEAILLSTRDITEEVRHEKEINEQLRHTAEDAKRASAAKTDFLRRMSHDIRTPINGIRGMVEIGNFYADNMEKQADCRKKIWQASEFLLDLVNNVLDMNKLESGELVLDETPFALTEISKEVAVIIRPQAEERGIVVKNRLPQITHYHVIGSPLYLRQILLNLAGNAVKYNRPGGTLEVFCREEMLEGDRSRFIFTVEDTGLGMSEEFQKHLFEPFSQEDASRRSSYTGTGLGLAITKELIEKMGGSITFESKLGVGTKFTFDLVFKIDRSASEEKDQENSRNCDLHGAKVLLVEDNELNREIAQFILENEGITVTDAVNGKDAVEVFKASEPGSFDFILMDVMMPVMDGLEATRQIRSLKREDAKKIPIFAMTANAFSDDRKRCKEAGMTEHLAKPLDSEKLIAKLRLYYCRKM